jgi:hypothetical protein
MNTPSDEARTQEPPTPTASPAAAPQPEPEFEYEQAEAFAGLAAWLVRGVERARIATGLLVMLGVALLRRLWQLGPAAMHLSVLALCAFAAAGIVYALATRMNRSVTAVSEVTRSTGRDVTHAMRALRGMRDVFRAIGAALVAAAALLLIATAVQLTRR